jgi:hypothetical protein
MSSTQSLTAVVTDIRKIEMRYYPVPKAAPTDAVFEERAQRNVIIVAGGRALAK